MNEKFKNENKLGKKKTQEKSMGNDWQIGIYKIS